MIRKPTLVQEARSWWKLWSVRINALGATLLAAMIGWPDVGLSIWHALPDEVKSLLGPRATLIVPLGFFVASMGARFLKQHKLSHHADE
jgi:hypothetical protein